MTTKFDNLYKDAIGTSNYDPNDPIVAFIDNLKKLNAEQSRLDEVAATGTANKADRKKSSVSFSDFDSSTFSDDEEEDDDDDEDDEEKTDVDKNSSDSDSSSSLTAKASVATRRNINKKFKRN